MYSVVNSSAVLGVNGALIRVEADVNDGLPMFSMVGYLSSAVREAAERVRTALKNSGFQIPPKRITINLSPADLRKDGSGFDLPIAISVLLAMGIEAKISMEDTIIIGELGLNGEIKSVTGVLPMIDYCHKLGMKRCIVPFDNKKEACLITGIEVIAASNLKEVVDYIQGKEVFIKEVLTTENRMCDINEENSLDFSEIHGQAHLKRGMEIAAAGFHNILMTGAAGAGKSMLAKRLPTILPELSAEESLEITKIYSVSGLLKDNGNLIMRRPFRSPHHTISDKALIGGGSIPRPGEISLAHNGVLFLDELPEFNKNALEVMRQPLEEREVTIARVNATYKFPADFMLVAAMNPCPCGMFPNRKKCTCTINQIKRYQSKISGPLLDRIDINLEVKPIEYKELFADIKAETSKEIRERVENARKRQSVRYQEEQIRFNSQLDGKLIQKYIILNNDCKAIVENVYKQLGLSARGVHRILKLARTIADLADDENIRMEHLQEAIYFRNNGDFYSNMEVGEYV